MATYAPVGNGDTKVKRTDERVTNLARDYGGQTGQEGALLNGLLALGYDPNFVRGLADADPNRRFLDDAVTRALRAGVLESDIRRALAATRAAAEGKPEEAVKALGVDPANLPPDSAAVYNAIATRQPLPFLDRGQVQAPAPAPAPTPAPTAAPATPPKTGGPRMRIAGPGLTTPAAGAKPPGGAPAPGTVTALTPGADRATEPFPTDPAKVRDWVARNNPEWLFLLDIPEVAAIIKDPSTWEEGADDADLRGKLMGTDWWKRTEPAAREWLQLRAQDPASADDQLAKRKTFLRNQAQQTGITVPVADLDRLAEDSLRFAWDDTEIQANLGNYFVYAQDRLTGAAQAARAHIEQQARDWLVPIDDTTVGNWVTQIIKGESTTDYFDTYLAQQAQSLFPQLADPISRGISPTRWMSPYKTIAAQTLELNPEEIDLRDPKWLRAVSQVDDKGARSAMSLYDWTNLIKTDDTYGFDKTQQGRDHGAQLARNIAAQFGFATGGGL